MPSFIKIESKPTFRDFQGRFSRTSKEVIKGHRDAVRTLGKKYVRAAKKEAPGEKFPGTIGYQTFISGNSVGFRVYAQQPLHTFITEGTKAHIIRGNPILAFNWDKGPDGPGMYFFAWVNHPGTQANPYHMRAWDEVEPDINPELRKISTRAFKVIQGS